MEEKFISHEELEGFKREIEGIKSTIEILQNKEVMEELVESERNQREGKEIKRLEI